LGDREQAPDAGGELVARHSGLGRSGGALDGRPRLRDLVEQPALVGCVALDRLDEVRDQVVSPLQLDVDVRPARLGLVPQPYQVVEREREQDRQHDEDDDHDDQDDHATSLLRTPALAEYPRTMRLWVGAAAVVALVLGGVWLVLAFAFGHLRGGQTAYARSARCLRADPALTSDPSDAARFTGSGLHTLGLRWKEVRTGAL